MSTLHVENLKGLSSGGNANKIIVPSGQTLHSVGHVIQVQHTVNTTADAASTASNYPIASGFKLSITPKFTSSKVFVIFDIDAWVDSGSNTNKIGKYGIRLNSQSNTIVSHKRFGVNLAGGTAGSQDVGGQITLTYMDSPNSTSAQEYELVLGRWSATYSNNVKINGGGFGHSAITLMEIAQ